MKLIVLRHAESKKNLSNTIGGPGASLTPRGILGITRTASRIRHSKIKPSHIFCAPTIQTYETGKRIKKYHLKCTLITTDLLTPIALGRLSGTTIDHSRKNHKIDLQALENWNKGILDISELSIQGMQSPWEFYKNGLILINKIKREAQCACVVATRSSLILLWHIKKRHTPEPGGGYKNKIFPYHRPITLNFHAQDFIWIRQQLQKNGTFPSLVS